MSDNIRKLTFYIIKGGGRGGAIRPGSRDETTRLNFRGEMTRGNGLGAKRLVTNRTKFCSRPFSCGGKMTMEGKVAAMRS